MSIQTNNNISSKALKPINFPWIRTSSQPYLKIIYSIVLQTMNIKSYNFLFQYPWKAVYNTMRYYCVYICLYFLVNWIKLNLSVIVSFLVPGLNYIFHIFLVSVTVIGYTWICCSVRSSSKKEGGWCREGRKGVLLFYPSASITLSEYKKS